MLEVHERRPHLAQEPRDPDRHSQRLAAGGKVERLDPVGHELGMPRDRREAQVGRRRGGQLAQEPARVGLVARPPAAEHVRVEHDERRGQEAASR
jgi:hypothetical protein